MNAPPRVDAAHLAGGSPCRPWRCEVDAAVDPDGDTIVGYRTTFVVDGRPLPGVGEDGELPAGSVTAGQEVQCLVAATDGTAFPDGGLVYGAPRATDPVVAADTAPVLTGLRIPGSARQGDTLRCEAAADDDCVAQPAVTYAWTVDGIPVPTTGPTLATSGLAPGAQVRCVGSTSDGVNPTVTATSDPVSIGASTWTLTGELANARAGYAVAVVGDLDLDGLAELAIGAPDGSAVGGATQAGMVYVVDGRDDVPETALADLGGGLGGFRLLGTSGGYDVRTMACTPYIVSGCPTIKPVGELDGEDRGPAGAGFGAALGYAGDLDGDGVTDLVASAPYELVSNLWRGRTYVMSGADLRGDWISGGTIDGRGYVFDGECGRRRDLDQAYRSVAGGWKAVNADLSGFHVVGLGDVNGDGLGDVAVASPNHGNDDEGTVHVVFGHTDGRGVTGNDLFVRGCGTTETTLLGVGDGTLGFAAYGPDKAITNSGGPQWGKRLATGGDFNGDGYDDVLIPSAGLGATNVAHLVLGGRDRSAVQLDLAHADATHNWAILLGDFSFGSGGSRGRIGVGFPSGGGGDVDGDGFDDLAFVENDVDRRTWLNVLFGRATDDGTLSTDETVDGSGRGYAVPGAIDMRSESGEALIFGDFDGDGFDDVAASSPWENGERGRTYVLLGGPTLRAGVSATSLLAGTGGFVVAGDEGYEHLGWALAGGDVDGDGLDDLVATAPGKDGAAGWDVGRVVVTFGRNRSGAIDQQGGAGDDVLVGSAADDGLVGGRGDDVLVGAGGVDVLYGGAGDDVLEVDDGAFRRVRGGRGEDLLVLAPAVPALDLRVARSRVQEIERIRLAGQPLTVTTSWVGHASDTSNRLLVEGGDGEVVTVPGDGWAGLGLRQLGDATYVVLADGVVQLWIDQRLDTTIPPTVIEDPIVVPENRAVGEVVARIEAFDPDDAGARLGWALVDDPSGALALDPATGELRVTDPAWFDFEAGRGTWTVRFTVTDRAGLTTAAAVEVALDDVDEAPAFVSVDPVWTVEEGTFATLGNVTAVDVDAGDLVTYTVVDDPSGLFDVDPVTGDVELLPGATLDHESGPLHLFTVAAVDLEGLSDEVVVELRVSDVEVLERSARLNFELRGWSIWDDQEASGFPGFTVDNQTTGGGSEMCLVMPSDDATHLETFGLPLAMVPTTISLEADIGGTICTRSSTVYDEGNWNATVPVDVELGLPDEIHAGDTITVTSSATPRDDGAALWGTTTSMDSKWELAFSNFTFYMAACDQVFSHHCNVVADVRSRTATWHDHWKNEPRTWTGGRLDDPGRFVLTVAEPVTMDTLDLDVDWDAMWLNLFTWLGLPSNRGHLDYPIGGANGGTGMVAEFDYVLWQTYVSMIFDAAWVFDLEVRGVDATLTFENGDVATFRLGTPAQVVVPADGDVDGDGDVDVTVDFALDSWFHDDWTHTERAGYNYTAGFGRIRVKDLTGNLLGQKQVGPLLDHFCAPKVKGQAVPITCFAGTDQDAFAYRPTGFTSAPLVGSLDLAPLP